MTMKSYGQNREDVLLDRLFPRGLPGFYVDIGANDPVKGSLTKHFYDLGWHGVNVEPARHAYEQLRAARERDINLDVGVSNKAGTLTFYELPEEISAASTFSAEEAALRRETGFSYEEREVPVITLADLCREHVGDRTIDFLSIDVEGHELEVLEGGDWKRWRPRVVVVEATKPMTTVPTHSRWEPLLLNAKYVFGCFDGLNRFYVRNEDKRLAESLAVPVNVTDDYLPYEYSSRMEELGWVWRRTRSELAAAKAVVASMEAERETLVEEYARVTEQLAELQGRYGEMEQALTGARVELQAVRGRVLEAFAFCTQVRDEADQLAADAAAEGDALADVGPTAIALAQRMGQLGQRHPKARSRAKRALRLALDARRRLFR